MLKSKYSTGPSAVAGLSSIKSYNQDADPNTGEGSSSGSHNMEGSKPDSCLRAECIFKREYDKHFDALMSQIVRSYGLSLSWLGVVKPLIMNATSMVRTDVFVDDVMDINEYVRIKKIACGEKEDSSINYGVVCTKNVTHKKMCTSIANPTILLLKCAFEFQRRENQLSCFDTLHLQENKYLKNLVDKVKAFRPKIILVQKSVSRLALEDLYDLGIVVVVNVKPSVMARVARCTQGEILNSLDQLFFDVCLGTCKNFYLRNFTLDSGIKKTLMYFDNCDPKFGCVITLQGGSKRELKKVKKVTQFGLHLAYNSLLESSFLLDEHAIPSRAVGGEDADIDDADVDDVGDVDDGMVEFSSFSDRFYSSTSVTPEFPLYPALAHPLDTLPASEVIRKLEGLNLLGNDGDDGDNDDRHDDEDELGEEEEGEDIKSEDPLVFKIDEGRGESVGTPPPKGPKATELAATEEESSEEGAVINSHAEHLQNPNSEAVVVSDSHSSFQQDPAVQLKAVDREVLTTLGEREFQAAMKRQLLSISPKVHFTVPYLQTVQGCEADLRQYLPNVIYWSNQFKTPPPPAKKLDRRISANIVQMGIQMQQRNADKSNSLSVIKENSTKEKKKPSRHARAWSHVSLYQQPSYKSVSQHPLTTSLLLLRANTNEMKAALADFRSRAGLSMEDNNFFFKSAKVAADYRLHLQNVFNKYKEFENEEADKEEEEEENVKKEEEVEVSKKKKKKRKIWKMKRATAAKDETPPASASGSQEQEAVSRQEVMSEEEKEEEEKQEQEMKRRETNRVSLSPPPPRLLRASESPSGHIIAGQDNTRHRMSTFEDMDRAKSEESGGGGHSDMDISYNDMWMTTEQVKKT